MALRTSLPVQPHLYIGDSTGRPLDYGMVYFGQPNKDPEFYPIDIYYDKDLSLAAAQPVRTKGGFLNANGDMTEIYASDYTYSVKVLDEHGVLVFYEPDMSSTSTSASVSTKLPYIGATDRNMADKNTDYITPKDFGATGNTEADLLGLSVIGLNEGSIIHTDNRSFTIAASNATDYDAITVGGAKLYINKEPTSFATRAEFVQAVTNGLKIKKNTVIQAGNVSYVYDKTSTEILDLPNFKPFGKAEFEHYGGASARSEPTKAFITHHRQDANTILDVVRIVNPKPDTFNLITHPETAPDGTSPRLTLREYSAINKIGAMVNSVAFKNADGSDGSGNALIKPDGVFIADGVGYSGWSESTREAKNQAIICTKNGILQPRYKSDGKDVNDYVGEGAVWGYSWGAWVAIGGAAQTVPTALASATLSARTIIGQAANGDYIVITAEGSSGSYGLTPDACGVVAVQHGCERAFMVDGGGSSQLWWGSFYALPSSDNDFIDERTLGNAMAINCPLSSYDTGWVNLPLASGFTVKDGVGVRLRQTDSRVNFEFLMDGVFTTDPTPLIAGLKPSRYMPQAGISTARGALVGASGALGVWYTGSGITIKKVTSADSTGYLGGHTSWIAKHATSNTP